MNITKAHPNKTAKIRALFTVSTRTMGFQLIANAQKCTRQDWNWHSQIGQFTITVIRLEKGN